MCAVKNTVFWESTILLHMSLSKEPLETINQQKKLQASTMLSEYNLSDEKGAYRLLGLKQRDGFWRASDRTKLFYPFNFVNPEDVTISLTEDKIQTVWRLSLSSGEKRTWRWSKEKVYKKISEWGMRTKSWTPKGFRKEMNHALKNREKEVIVDALRDKYPLPSLLRRVSLSKSSYYYQRAVSCLKDKYSGIRRKITEL